MEHVELLPVREALAFDFLRYTNVQGLNLSGQSNTALAALVASSGNQFGVAVANQGIVVNQL